MKKQTKEKIIQIIAAPYSLDKGNISSQLWGLSNKGRLFFLESSAPAENKWVLRAGAEEIKEKCSNCGKSL